MGEQGGIRPLQGTGTGERHRYQCPAWRGRSRAKRKIVYARFFSDPAEALEAAGLRE